jgi:cytochrome o ubiquinol oxidase subunit III
MIAGDAAATAEEQELLEQRALGFWLYLMSDAIMFALLFASYVVMAPNVAGGPGGKALFSLPNAFAETMLLLVSSTTFGFSALATASGRRGGLLSWLAVTFLLGSAFLVLELREFYGLIQRGAGPDRSGFLSAFFTLVGTHGLHVSAGLIWIVVMAAQVALKGLTVPVISRLRRLGMFWHFLDIVWIGIFSVVYLPGVL